ncbi:unnamed protein product [Dovyalis caffra]|uniref:Uncharacterized protein n=1 Tax=Dovyalis caffra TaxID=77055 RepID=A0AAV1QVR1_9ROSI|nr:unnamed protein product [Dovyalis caffra]
MGTYDPPRVGLMGRTLVETEIGKDLQTFYYSQTLDRFTNKPESYNTFQQRYVINSKYWGGANTNASIFAFSGAESPLDNDLKSVGFHKENVPPFKSLQDGIQTIVMEYDDTGANRRQEPRDRPGNSIHGGMCDPPRVRSMGRTLVETEIGKDLQTFYYKFTTKHLITSIICLKAATLFNNDMSSIQSIGVVLIPVHQSLPSLGQNHVPLDNDLKSVGFLKENVPPFKSLQVYKEVSIIGVVLTPMHQSLPSLGAESPLDNDLKSVGFLKENAPFKALQVYREISSYPGFTANWEAKVAGRNPTQTKAKLEQIKTSVYHELLTSSFL